MKSSLADVELLAMIVADRAGVKMENYPYFRGRAQVMLAGPRGAEFAAGLKKLREAVAGGVDGE